MWHYPELHFDCKKSLRKDNIKNSNSLSNSESSGYSGSVNSISGSNSNNYYLHGAEVLQKPIISS